MIPLIPELQPLFLSILHVCGAASDAPKYEDFAAPWCWQNY